MVVVVAVAVACCSFIFILAWPRVERLETNSQNFSTAAITSPGDFGSVAAVSGCWTVVLPFRQSGPPEWRGHSF